MKYVIYEDESGKRWRALLRDGDPDHMAAQGLPAGPPNVDNLDWDSIRRDLHNALTDRELFDVSDVQQQQTGLTGVILYALRRRLIDLYHRETGD